MAHWPLSRNPIVCPRFGAVSYFKKHGKLPGILAFVDGVTAAAIGAITGAVFVLAKRSIVDVPTILLALGTIALLLNSRNCLRQSSSPARR
ncbi:hypothetical protein CTP10_R68420 (plasmid) [Cupriavidus sp. P-10]|nr:hypothetical protein CTP10_R68420 [Cupriavidus sp. P-10]